MQNGSVQDSRPADRHLQQCRDLPPEGALQHQLLHSKVAHVLPKMLLPGWVLGSLAAGARAVAGPSHAVCEGGLKGRLLLLLPAPSQPWGLCLAVRACRISRQGSCHAIEACLFIARLHSRSVTTGAGRVRLPRNGGRGTVQGQRPG